MSNNQKPQINLALAAILSDIDKIAKDRKNEAQGFRFRGIDDCYNHLHPIFAAHGVVCIPRVESVEQTQAGQTAKGTPITRSVVTVVYYFVASDGSEQFSKVIAEAMDSADKGIAKAMSAAHKNLLLQVFLIPTSDVLDADEYDPTVDAHEELRELKELRARQAVEQSIATGEPPPHPNQGKIEEYEAKREQAAREVAGNSDKARRFLEEKIAGEKSGLLDAPEPKSATVTPPEAEKRADEAPEAKTEPPIKTRKSQKEPKQEAPLPDVAPTQEEGDWRVHVVNQISIAKFRGMKLGDIAPQDIDLFYTGWVVKYRDKFKDNPAKMAEAKAVTEAHIALFPGHPDHQKK